MNKTKDTATQPSAFQVAHHDGPPEITFYGIRWRRGVPQSISAEAWRGMQARGDFNEFDFRVVTDTSHDSRLTTHDNLEE